MPKQKLSRKQKRELLWRLAVGDSPTKLKKIYGITDRYIRMLRVEAGPITYYFDPCWTCGTENLPKGDCFCSLGCEIKFDEAHALANKNGDMSLVAKLFTGKIRRAREDIQNEIDPL